MAGHRLRRPGRSSGFHAGAGPARHLALGLIACTLLASAPSLAQTGGGGLQLPTCEELQRWQDEAPDPQEDPQAFAGAIQPLLETWEAVRDLDPANARLDDSARASIACCARLVAELAEVGWLPEGVTQVQALHKAVDFAGPAAPFPRFERAELEADLIEALFLASRHGEGFSRVEGAREAFADVPQLLAEMLLLGANAQENLGAYAAALAYADESRALLESLPPAARANSYVWIYSAVVRAKILIHIGVPDQAAPLLEAARGDQQAAGPAECESMLLTAETELAQARGDWEWIVERVGQALAAGEILGDAPEEGPRRALVVAQASALRAMQSKRALEAARPALESALRAVGLQDPTSWPAALTLCDLELALDRVAQADALAREVASQIRASGIRPSLAVRSNLAGVRGRTALNLEPAPEEFSERLVDVQVALADLLEAWDSVPHREGGVGFLHFDERRALLVTLSRMLPAQRALEHLLEVERRGSLARRFHVDDASSQRVQARLVPAAGGVLVFLPSAWGSMAFTLDAAGLRTWDLPGSDAWAELDVTLAAAMQPEHARGEDALQRVRELATALRDRVLTPELDLHISRWEEIVLVRTENLGRVPFEVLPLAGRGGAPLGLALATSYLPSLSIGLGLIDRREQRPAPAEPDGTARILIAVGPTAERPQRAGERWQPIPWSDDDARRLSEPWPDGHVQVELDPDRALERLLRAGEARIELAELVAHGVRDPNLERSQGFFLQSDRGVFAHSLADLRAAPLCVLMVCGSSAGTTRRGDDLGSHLAAAFLAGGADVVAGSDTDLSFEAGVALLEEFHHSLALGATPARALLAARRRLASQAHWAHPAFHSNLTLTGVAFLEAPAGLRVAPADLGPAREPGAVSPGSRIPWAWLGLAGVALGALAIRLARSR